jgi:hypothetical protein
MEALRTLLVALMALGFAGRLDSAPDCRSAGGRRAERLRGVVKRGEPFERLTADRWILRLRPDPEGWFLEVSIKGREEEDLSRLTPPWHFVPNPREIEGWHFRNASNTGPNEGSVNAPQELREFIFSPAVGQGIEYNGSATSPEDVEKVRAYGRGWLFIEKYTLTPPARGARAAFETMTFSACLTWPGTPTQPAR